MSVEKIIKILSPKNSIPSYIIIEKLLSIGTTMTKAQGEKFMDDNHPELLEISHLARTHYNDYILESEDEQSKVLLSGIESEKFKYRKTANEFGSQAYSRVNDIFKNIDFSKCKKFTMVGCGTLPVTMFQVFEHTKVPEIVSIDVREEAVSTVKRIVEKYQMNRINPLLASGDAFDYSDSDVVYIANMVSPKKRVLERVIETARPTVQIVVRDPYSIGRLWTERGVDVFDERYEITEYGKLSPAYFSQDIFLRPVS